MWTYVLAGAIVAVALVIYFPAIDGEPIFDDLKFLTRSPQDPLGRSVQAEDGWRRIWLAGETPNYWPITYSILRIEWRRWEMDTTGYHVVNILLHAFASVLFWQVLKRLKIPGAALAGLIFAVHPVCVASVAWIIELKNTLSMVFYLLTILAYLRHERIGSWRSYVLALSVYAVTLLCKTSVVMLPVVLPALAWLQSGRINRTCLLRTIPFFVLSMTAAFVSLHFERPSDIPDWADFRPGGIIPRLANAGWVVWFYLYKAVIPLKLSMIYEKWPVDAASVVFWLPAAALVGSLAVLWRLRRRWPARALLLAIGYFVVMVFPVVGFFDMSYMQYSWVADQFQYVPMLSVIALVAAAWGRWGLRRGDDEAVDNSPGRPPTRAVAAWAIAAVVVGTFAVLTWRQAGVFSSKEVVWRDTIRKNPQAAIAHNNLGTILSKRGQHDEAAQHFRETIQRRPNYFGAHYNLGQLLAVCKDPDGAAKHLGEAVRIQPEHASAQYKLGLVLINQGKFDAAAEHFVAAVRIKPDFPGTHHHLAKIYARRGEYAKAAKHEAEVKRLTTAGLPRPRLSE